MTDQPENPPAFPRTGEGFGNSNYDTPGMSLRDWFAGQALASMIGEAAPIASTRERSLQLLATQCFAIADAMLAERTKAPLP